MSVFTLEPIPILSVMIAAPITLAIQLACFVVVLFLVKYAAKVSWLNSIAASVILTTIVSIFAIHMLLGTRLWLGQLQLPIAICAVIVVIQFFRRLTATDTAQANVNTAERNRILKMVEEGKIQTEEGAELLDAMGRSSALQGQDAFSRLDIAMLVGVALVILGFFLPWAYLGSGMYQVGHQRGPIGWAILIAAVLSAVPIFVTPKELLYKISMLQIFLIMVGLALVIKELSVGADNEGTILCLAGFVVAFFGSGAKLKSLAA